MRRCYARLCRLEELLTTHLLHGSRDPAGTSVDSLKLSVAQTKSPPHTKPERQFVISGRSCYVPQAVIIIVLGEGVCHSNLQWAGRQTKVT